MSNFISLKEFIEKNGKILGETIEKYLTPVWKPNEKVYEKEIANLLRKPFPVQKELIKGLAKAMYQENRRKLFICGEMGTGKAQPLDAKILTPDGWKTMGEIQIGDKVIGANGKPTEVCAVFPQGEKNIYRVTFTDGSFTECCEDHLWQITTPLRKWRGNPPKILTLKEIMSKELKNKNGNFQYFIPMVKPVEFPTKKQEIDPYLLGVLLGDGNLSENHILISKNDENLFEEIKKVLPKDVTLKKVNSKVLTYRITTGQKGNNNNKNSLLQSLRKIGLSGIKSIKKFIPYDYKFGDVSQRIALLQGLLDTDGYVGNGANTIEYSTSSQTLAEDVLFLVQSLGGTATIIERFPVFTYKGETRYGHKSYRLFIALPSYISPFRNKTKREKYKNRTKYEPTRAISEITYVGKKEAKCIKVTANDGLYVTDNFIVTHNTTIALSVVACSPKPLRTLVVCPTHLVEKWIRETKLVIPDVTVVDLAVKEAISILQGLKESKKPEKHEVWVISKERAKLSYSWKPVYITKKDKNVPLCPRCYEELIDKEKGKIYTENILNTKKCLCPNCGESLWQAIPKPRRYSVAEYIKKYLKHRFDFLILDEIHDYKAGDTLQGNAMGMLTNCTKYFLGLTGTFSGGYASDIFYLLYRIAPHELKDYQYSGAEVFQKQYGVIEEIRKLENEKSYMYGRGNKRSVIVKKRPGISPEVVGKYLLHRSCFVRLSDVIDGLPPYDEYVVALEMDNLQAAAYRKLESQLREAVSYYKMKAIAPMLQSLLCYPDSCTVFPEEVKIKEKDSQGRKQVIEVITAPQLPANLQLPKERELIELCKKEKAEKRKVLVYIVYTGTRDIRQRIKSILEKQGFKVGILPETVEPKKREEWINKHKDFDVLISNPELVKLGLDLYDYPTIVFFEVGYNIFTLRQAARRSWRIGQSQPVRVFYYCYKNTMQEAALYLTAKKVEQALLLEGDLPEGLAAEFSESGSIVEELAKTLVEGRSYTGAETAWAQMRKREIETNLGINAEENIFLVVSSNKKDSIAKEKVSISENVTVSVFIQQGRKKSVSRLTVKQSDMDSLKEKYGALQYCLI